jgi:putative hydrolase of the HAD superfamily
MKNNKIFWNKIDWVLLDMDGTLLDKYFDDYFWETLIPKEYAKKYDLSFKEAKDRVVKLYHLEEGSLNWTDLDFWSKKLNLDIPFLKGQISHLIDIHPDAKTFLTFLKKMNKNLALITNAHYKTLSLKLKQTKIGPYFNEVLSCFEIGLPKEDKSFWLKLKEKFNFDPTHTLFIDDNEGPLLAAKEAGIKYLFFKSRPSSKSPPKLPKNNFLKIEYFKELM